MVQDNLYSDLDFFNKENLLISPHLFHIFKELGFEYLKKIIGNFSSHLNNFLEVRLEKMFFDSKKLLEGKISQEDARKKISFFHPLFLTCRLDLKRGSSNLLFGNSIDLNTFLVNDFTLDITNNHNVHLEQGILTEYEFLSDENFYIKDKGTNIEIKDAYKMTKSSVKTCRIIQRVMIEKKLKEILQYPSSNNSIFLINLSSLLNTFFEPSNYENLGHFWDYYNGNFYHLAEPSFTIFPNFPLMKSLMLGGRHSAMKTLGKISSDKKMILNTIEDMIINWIKAEFPEIYEDYLLKTWVQGIPTPKMSLDLSLKPSNLIDKEEKLIRNYPKGNKITQKILDLLESDLFKGYYTNISEDFDLNEKISSKNIYSKILNT